MSTFGRPAPRVVVWAAGLIAVLVLTVVAVAALTHRDSSPTASTSSASRSASPATATSGTSSANSSASAAAGAPAGQLIKSEPYTQLGSAQLLGRRILYSTKTATGAVVRASALVVVAKGSTGQHPTVLWDHGTTGAGANCAPSTASVFSFSTAMTEAIRAGAVLVAPDYIGEGERAVKTYLVGQAEGQASLDALRGATHLTAAELGGASVSPSFVVWGHSQGGHAALWTAILAGSYAPELKLLGVAAIAPATDLTVLSKTLWGNRGDPLVSSYILTSYADNYPSVRVTDYVRADAVGTLNQLAQLCSSQTGQVQKLVAAAPGGSEIFTTDTANGALGEELAANTPNLPISAPMLVAQGTNDAIIPPQITSNWVAARCAAGQHIQFKLLDGLDHASILAESSPLNTLLVQWSTDRFAGKAATPTC